VLSGTRSFSPADNRSLQHTIGNQAVQRLLARTAHRQVIQSKLMVRPARGTYEQEVSLAATAVDSGTHALVPSLSPPKETIQRQVEEAPLQRQSDPTQKKENTTGLPDSLKDGIEHLSGISMDDVQVHYNSSKPAELQAWAHTQGTEIHVGPGQERHLAHEAWHVVQQKQGRVDPTVQLNGVEISADAALEQEADVMGANAARHTGLPPDIATCPKQLLQQRNHVKTPVVIQAKWEAAADDILKWDKSIMAIRWYYNKKTDKFFYHIEKGMEHWFPAKELAELQENAGKEFSYEDWWAAGEKRVEGIVKRVATYREFASEGKYTRETGLVKRGPSAGMRYVEDTFKEGYNFVFKEQSAQTHFHNNYTQELAQMRENYRTPKLKAFFASDVFFDQFATAVKEANSLKGNLLDELPEKPPEVILRDTIDNEETKEVLKGIDLGTRQEREMLPTDPLFGAILNTPNGKATYNIVNDYNFLNRSRQLPAYTIAKIVIENKTGNKETGWKIYFHIEKAG
jgi:hypothetical protein